MQNGPIPADLPTDGAGPSSTIPYRLVLFPGLGADERLFAAQREAFPYLEVPQWLEPQSRESLEQYGRRMAQRVATASEAPLYLGGASFGGSVAMEVARHLRPRAVFLIGSCRGAGAVPPLYRLLGRLARPLPSLAYAALVRAAPCGVSLFGPATAAQRAAFLAQLADTSPSFLRWGIGALLRWTPPPALPCPVCQIHGGRDRILPCRRASPDLIIPGAGHLVNVTHAAEVNRFILERLGG
jgi:pimeloyl-ACP methyl ester carboxylesterase